jgi:hypothetical protein
MLIDNNIGITDSTNRFIVLDDIKERAEITRSRDFSMAVRISKRNSLSMTFDKKRQAFAIIIPYDDETNKYMIKQEDIHELESKDYINDTLEKFNKLFQMDKSYIPISLNILLFLFDIIFTIAMLYGGAIVGLLCLYNPMILIFLLWLMVQILLKFVVFIHHSIGDKFKQRKIKAILKEESSKSDKVFNITWEYGRDGSWLEILKKEMQNINNI